MSEQQPRQPVKVVITDIKIPFDSLVVIVAKIMLCVFLFSIALSAFVVLLLALLGPILNNIFSKL